MQSVLQAGLLKVLSLVSGHRRALSCVTLNGRPEQAGAERSLGLFLNSVPLALDLKSLTWRELIKQVAEIASAQHGVPRLSHGPDPAGRRYHAG